MKTKLFLFGLLIGITFSSCSKNEGSTNNSSDDSSVAVVTDAIINLKSLEAVEEEEQTAVAKVHEHGMHKPDLFRGIFAECATVSQNIENYPKEIIINYGDSCVGHHGDTLSGIITITMTDTIINAGAKYSIIYNGVYYGDKSIELKESIENLGQDADSNWTIVHLSEQTISYPDGTTSYHYNNDTTIWINGFTTSERDDDIYYKTGNGKTVSTDGNEYSKWILTPLLYDKSCRYIKEGVIKMINVNDTIIIDFGDGSCDDLATMTKNGETTEINLHGDGLHHFNGHSFGPCVRGKDYGHKNNHHSHH